jgi:hypothetical protein
VFSAGTPVAQAQIAVAVPFAEVKEEPAQRAGDTQQKVPPPRSATTINGRKSAPAAQPDSISISLMQ